MVKLLVTFSPGLFRSTTQTAVFEWPMLAIWTGAGAVGAWLATRTGFAPAWTGVGAARSRVTSPIMIGLILGVAAIVTDWATGWAALAAAEMNIPSIHIAWPASLVVYPGGAIVVEIVYRLLPIPLILWLFSNGLLRGKGQSALFWTLALVTSAIEPYGDMELSKFGPATMWPVLVQDYALNLVQAWIFRRSGYLASIICRTSFYFVWHVLWGLA